MNTFNFKFRTLILTLMGVLFMSIGDAYAGGTCYTRGRAFLRPGSPVGAGKVYVDRSSSVPSASWYEDCNSYTTPASQFAVAGDATFYFWAQANAGYKFTGWYDANGDLAKETSPYVGSIKAGSMALQSKTFADLDMYAGFIKCIQMSFVRPENGSFSISNNKASIADYASFTVDGLVVLTATPAVGYKLRGWYTTPDGGVTRNYFAFCNTCEPNFTENVTIGAEFVPDDGKATFWVKGTNLLYDDLGAANTAAASSASKTIVVVSDGVVGAGTYTINSGVTLLVPGGDKLYGEKYDVMTTPRVIKVANSSATYMKTTTFRKLGLVDGVTINCSGNICIGGTLASVGGGNASSFPTGMVGMIDMSRGGTINLKSGSNLYAWGFVKGQDMDQGNNAPGSGSGNIVAENGSLVWEFFQVGDWRGGTASSSIYSKSEKWRFFPFQSYTVQNIEVPVTFQYGSCEKCQWSIYGNAQINTISFTLIANSSAVFTIGSDGAVTKWYDPTTDRLCVELTGSSNLGSIALNVLGQTMDSGNYNLPLPAHLKLVIKGSTTISKPVVAHAGSIIEVHAGGTLNLNSQMFLYDKDDWDTYCMYSNYYRTFNSPSIHFNRGDGTSKTLLEDATLVVDGSVIVGSGDYLYATAHGANIMGNGGGTIQYKKLAGNSTMTQCKELSSNVSVNIRSANLHNENGTYTQGSVATYKNVHGRWFLLKNSTPKSDKTYDFRYIKSGDVYGSGGTSATVSAVWTKKKSGLDIMEQWANIKAGDCDDWWAGLDDDCLYNWTESKAWHQFVKTSLSYEDATSLVWHVYSGTNGKLFAMTEECDIEEYAASSNCLYNLGGVTKALVGNDFIAVAENTDDAAYHKADALTTYYICLEDCNWQPATRVTGEHNAYTAGGTTYIWYSNHWQAVQLDPVIGLYYSLSAENVQICYAYEGGEWVLATAVAEVINSESVVQPAYSLSSAVAKAKAGGDDVTIRLLREISGAIYYDGGNNCSLDLNGFTLSGTASGIVTVDNSAARLIIKDQSASSNGTIQLNYNANERRYAVVVKRGICFVNSGKVSVANSHSTAGAAAVDVQNGASFRLNGGTIEATSVGETWGIYTESSSTSNVLISGGTLDVKSTSASAVPTAIYSAGGLTTISAGVVSATTTSSTSAIGVQLTTNSSRLKMVGGTLAASAKSNAIGISGITGASSATATVSGGTVNATTTTGGTAAAVRSYGITTVSGGELNATAAAAGAYGVDVKSGTTTISGGTINASAPSSAYGFNSIATLNVNGGTFNATTTASSTAYGLYTSAGTATVNNGYFFVTTKTSDAYGLYVNTTTPTCIINGGMFMVKSNAGTSTTGAQVNGYSSTSVKLTFNGGYFNIAPQTAGSTFLGAGKGVKDVKQETEPTIYGAGYLKKVAGNEYTVTWKDYDGSSLNPATTRVESGKVPQWTGDTPAYSSAGSTFVFDGWCTGPGNTGAAYIDGAPLPEIVASDKTYYAHYKMIVAEVTVNGTTTTYTNIQTAWNNAKSNKQATIRLLANMTDMPQMEFNPSVADAIITLDLNGYHWDMTGSQNSPFLKINSSNGGKLIITDNGDGSGYLLNKWQKTSSGGLYCVQVVDGELVLDAGAVKCENTSATQDAVGVYVNSGNSFAMLGGSVEALKSHASVTGGMAYGLYVEAGASVELTSGTVKATGTSGSATGICAAGEVNAGNQLKVEVAGKNNCYAVKGFGTLTVNGGEYKVTNTSSATSALFYPYTEGGSSANFVIQGDPEGTVTANQNGYVVYTESGNSNGVRLALESGSFSVSATGSAYVARTAGTCQITVNGGSYMSSMYWFYADGGSKLNINGGKFKSASTSNTIHSSSSTASLKIYGGWYSDMTKSTLENYVPYPGNVSSLLPTDQPEYGEGYRYHVTSKYTIRWKDGATVLRTDYVDRNVTPSYGADPERVSDNVYQFMGWSPEIVPATEDAIYTATWQKVEAEIIVQEHTRRFARFADAFQYVNDNELSEATIRLLSSVETDLTYTFNKPYNTTIDLNNHPLTYTGTSDKFVIVDNSDAVLTITDNSDSKNGIMDVTAAYSGGANGVLYAAVVTRGELVLAGGKVSVMNTAASKRATAVSIEQGATFTMTNGTLQAKSPTYAKAIYTSAESTVQLSGGRVISSTEVPAGTWGDYAYGIHLDGKGTARISGETAIEVYSNKYTYGIYTKGTGNATVEGGDFTVYAYDQNAHALHTEASSSITVNGGSFTTHSTAQCYVVYVAGIINISGGTFIMNNNDGTTNMNIIRGINNSTLNISGGTFSSTKTTNGVAIRMLGGTTTITGNPSFSSRAGIEIANAYPGGASGTFDAVMDIYGGTFDVKAELFRSSKTTKSGSSDYVKGVLTVYGGYFKSTYGAFIPTPTGDLALYGGYYNETSGTTHHTLLNTYKGSGTSVNNVPSTDPAYGTYTYMLDCKYQVTWKAGTNYTKVEELQRGATPVNDEVTSYIGTGGKTYIFTGWSPTPAPVTADITYTAVGICYEAKVKIGEGEWTYYTSFTDAWNVVKNNNLDVNATIVLLNDATVTEQLGYVPLIGNARTILDLNNHTLAYSGTAGYFIRVNRAGCQLTITDESPSGQGKVLHQNAVSSEKLEGVYISLGELVLLKGTIYVDNSSSAQPAYGVHVGGTPDAKFTMKGGNVEAYKSAGTLAYGVVSGGISNITGGSIHAESVGASAFGVEVANNTTTIGGNVNIKAVVQKGAAQGVVVSGADAVCYITGGSINSEQPAASAVQYNVEGFRITAGTANISGGTFTVTNNSTSSAASTALRIRGGKLNITSNEAVFSAKRGITQDAGSPETLITGGKFDCSTVVVNSASYGTLTLQGGFYTKNTTSLANYVTSPYALQSTTAADRAEVGSQYKYKVVNLVAVGFMLDIIDADNSGSSLVINASDWPANGWPYTINDVSYPRTEDRTLVIPYVGAVGDEYTVTVKNVSDEIVSLHDYIIPKVIQTNTVLTADQSAPIFVKEGKTLTVNTNITTKNIYVAPTAKLVIGLGAILTADTIFLRTKAEGAAELENNGSIASLTTVCYTRIVKSKAGYFQFGLPVDCADKVNEVKLSNGTDPRYYTGSGWVLRQYNEQSRAENGPDGPSSTGNWTSVQTGEGIAGGKGYNMYSGVNYYREFYFPVDLDALDDKVAVTYTSTGELQDRGWNVLVSPLTVTYINTPEPEGLVVGWLGEDGGSTQMIPDRIPPATVFVYQTPHAGYISFENLSIELRNNAPRRIKAADEWIRIQWVHLDIVNRNGEGDQTSVYSHPTRYEQSYKTGIDVAKQMFTGPHAILYSAHAYGQMAFAGVADAVLEQGVPLTVYSPSAQELTISMRDNEWLERLEKVYLVDKETGLRTDLFTQDYTFDAEAGTTEGRFVIQGVFKALHGTTDIENGDVSDGKQVRKLLIKDKMYIMVNDQLYDATGKQVK